MDKLTVEDIQKILSTAKLPITFSLGEQLLDTMRDNERLKAQVALALKIPDPFNGDFEPFAMAMEECARQNENNEGKGFTSLNNIVIAAIWQWQKPIKDLSNKESDNG